MKKSLLTCVSFLLAFIFAFMPLSVLAKESAVSLADIDGDNYDITLLNAQDTITYIQTPTGMDVEVFIRSSDLSENAKENSIEDNYDKFGDNILFISDPTTRYNCHSYAWYSQDYETNIYWMNSPAAYFDNPYNYQNSHKESSGLIGDIIVYFDATGTAVHSGIVVGEKVEAANGILGGVNLKIIQSKWGDAGLYTHAGDKCPYVAPYDTSSYVAAYVKYYTPKDHTHTWDVSFHNDGWDEIYCTYCGLTMYHDLSVEYINESVHTLSCSFCGDFYSFTHNLTYVDNEDNLMHHLECSLCGIVQSFVHQCTSFVDSELDGYHKGVCTVCGGNFYQFHTCTSYVNSSVSGYHQGNCTVCNDIVYQRHEWTKFANKYRCIICNFVTTNISAFGFEGNEVCLG